MWTILKTMALTACSWAVALAAIAGLMVLAWALGPATSTGHDLTFGQAFGGLSALALIVGTVRFAVVAPLVSGSLKRGERWQGDRWRIVLSVVMWPPVRS